MRRHRHRALRLTHFLWSLLIEQHSIKLPVIAIAIALALALAALILADNEQRVDPRHFESLIVCFFSLSRRGDRVPMPTRQRYESNKCDIEECDCRERRDASVELELKHCTSSESNQEHDVATRLLYRRYNHKYDPGTLERMRAATRNPTASKYTAKLRNSGNFHLGSTFKWVFPLESVSRSLKNRSIRWTYVFVDP